MRCDKVCGSPSEREENRRPAVARFAAAVEENARNRKGEKAPHSGDEQPTYGKAEKEASPSEKATGGIKEEKLSIPALGCWASGVRLFFPLHT